MSVKKTIEDNFNPLFVGFNKLANDIRYDCTNVVTEIHKLTHKPLTLYRVVIVCRNWLNTLLLCIILAFLLSSCFVSARAIHLQTPRIDVEADTATAFTWPYNTKFE